MGAVSVIALVVFSVLRFQETAYQPKLKYYERKAPPAIGDGILAWSATVDSPACSSRLVPTEIIDRFEFGC